MARPFQPRSILGEVFVRKFNRMLTVVACAASVSWILFACQEAPPDNHEDIVRAGLAEILSHQETGCEDVVSWEIDSRFDYLVRCANGMKFRIHVGDEGHVNVKEHLQATSLRPFDETLEMQGLTFRVQSDNNSALNLITVTPSGLAIDDAPVTAGVHGNSSISLKLAKPDGNWFPTRPRIIGKGTGPILLENFRRI